MNFKAHPIVRTCENCEDEKCWRHFRVPYNFKQIDEDCLDMSLKEIGKLFGQNCSNWEAK